jgi:hypothetical protein
MKCLVLILGVAALAMTALAADQPNKLGPEWTYDRNAQHYFKMMQIKVVRSVGGKRRELLSQP